MTQDKQEEAGALRDFLMGYVPQWRTIAFTDFQSPFPEKPLHEFLSHLLAVINADDLEYAICQSAAADGIAFNMVAFTKRRLIIVSRDEEWKLDVRTLSRATITGVRVLDAPMSTTSSPYTRGGFLQVEATYPSLEIALSPTDRTQSDHLEAFLPSLLADLDRAALAD